MAGNLGTSGYRNIPQSRVLTGQRENKAVTDREMHKLFELYSGKNKDFRGKRRRSDIIAGAGWGVYSLAFLPYISVAALVAVGGLGSAGIIGVSIMAAPFFIPLVATLGAVALIVAIIGASILGFAKYKEHVAYKDFKKGMEAFGGTADMDYNTMRDFLMLKETINQEYSRIGDKSDTNKEVRTSLRALDGDVNDIFAEGNATAAKVMVAHAKSALKGVSDSTQGEKVSGDLSVHLHELFGSNKDAKKNSAVMVRMVQGMETRFAQDFKDKPLTYETVSENIDSHNGDATRGMRGKQFVRAVHSDPIPVFGQHATSQSSVPHPSPSDSGFGSASPTPNLGWRRLLMVNGMGVL